jgi:uncharacterized protein
MKWTIQELVKLANIDNTYNEIIDFSDKIDKTDIVKITPVIVKGDFEIYDGEEFIFYSSVKCKITMECAITLKEVEVDLDFEVEDTFSTYEDENNYSIEGITIDLLPIIWSNILLEKPMRVLSEDAYENFDLGNTEFEDEEDTQNAFAKLKDYEK